MSQLEDVIAKGISSLVDVAAEYLKFKADLRDFVDKLLGSTVFDVVCDLGCGDGQSYGSMLRKHAKTLVGFDLNPNALELASRIYDKVILADIRQFDKYLNGFDAVFMFDSIEHLPKEDGYNLLRRVIPKAKFILVATPSRFNPACKEFISTQKIDKHASIWTIQDFQQLGFQVWSVQQTHPFWKNFYGNHCLAIRGL